MVESNICTRCARSLKEASASKKVSNTPLRLKRQTRFQMLFQEAELGRQRSPSNVVDREIVQGFEPFGKLRTCGRPALVPTPRAAGIEHREHKGPPKASHP